MEENAINYDAGYVVRKELKKYHKADDNKGAALASTLNGMIGENAYSNIDATETYLDYVKTWTVENDRGKLIHVTHDIYQFFHALEEATYELLQDGISKQGAISQVVGNPAVDFYWDLITDGLKKDWSSQLLSEICILWFTIRGFSVASKLLEDYKRGMKKNIKGTKGLRKNYIKLMYLLYNIISTCIHPLQTPYENTKSFWQYIFSLAVACIAGIVLS